MAFSNASRLPKPLSTSRCYMLRREEIINMTSALLLDRRTGFALRISLLCALCAGGQALPGGEQPPTLLVAVDHRAGTLSIQTPNRGRIDVIVLPSTNIQDAKNKFHTIADIDRGDRVEVFVSQRGPLFIAQIIHLR